MIQLIIGGSGSGKSAYAEQEAVRQHQSRSGQLYYIATMEVFDEESRKRIQRHRDMRRDKNFTTLECQTHLEQVKVTREDTVLLECLSNLTANEMYSENGRGEQAAQVIMQGIRKLAAGAGNLILVGNNVHEDGSPYDASTHNYIRQLAGIQQKAAALSDALVEVVHGLPLVRESTSNERNQKSMADGLKAMRWN